MVAAARRARAPLYRRPGGMLSGFRLDDRPMPPLAPRRLPLLALFLLLLGSVGIAAGWVLSSQAVGGQASWIAVLAALDAALMLRLGTMRPGWARAAAAVVGTMLAIGLANWGIVASEMGAPMGLLPWESLFRLGPGFVWLLTKLANGPVDFAWWGAALVVAAVASR